MTYNGPEVWELKVLEFARAILHGDDTHKLWLLTAAANFVSGVELPPPANGKPAVEVSKGALRELLLRWETEAASDKRTGMDATYVRNWFLGRSNGLASARFDLKKLVDDGSAQG